MEYSIEGGTTRLIYNEEGSSTYVYHFTYKSGEYSIVFLSNTIPKIGDKIVNGVLAPLVGAKINNDTSKWDEFYGRKTKDPYHMKYMDKK